MQCQAGRVTASGALNGSEEEGRQPDCMKLRGRKLHWYDVMALTVAGTSVLAFVVTVVVLAVESFENKVKQDEETQADQEDRRTRRSGGSRNVMLAQTLDHRLHWLFKIV